ncbi:MAG: type II 3-dehydroquinate dehydratase [Parafannyhessea umbonata]|uniref:3-dehydroquinate dehydratase n=1 Tax=Parafannyhessea umbonata TaxID=604330 RepID=A0A6N7WWW8_9ACTN|nr:type II 3-dehydroquinate dehydratase [Parafannyhessea umbonata]MDD6358372.1 type II 3-dehydroquinate dehydratase [Parafannyhessea umbonata]MST61120.1 type II 3-dehydroquinate dehydratase [Parafannyhessea umbonata]
MDAQAAARAVLKNIGGKGNVVQNDLCMTRLRLRVANPTLIDRDALINTTGVLGVVTFGSNGLEVVFGPRSVQEVFNAFQAITGLEPTMELPPLGRRAASGINVHITDTKPREAGIEELAGAIDDAAPAAPQPRAQALLAHAPLTSRTAHEEDSRADATLDLQRLMELDGAIDPDDDADDLYETFEDDPADDDPAEDDPAGEKDADIAAAAPSPAGGPRLLVINGPNINLLGVREPDLYGHEDYASLLALCHEVAEDAGFASCECYQSNHEGAIVDRIQEAMGTIDGIVINPAAYTHTSVAILDALKAVQIPAVEVHISKVSEREDFRQVSYVRKACFETVMGMGIQGYAKAIRDLADHLSQR